jgi:hypothetical protein
MNTNLPGGHYISGFRGDTWKEAQDKYMAAHKAQQAAIKADLKKRKARVVGMEDNGKFVDVRFTRDDGERVVGCFELVEWAQPPAAVWNAMDERTRAAAEVRSARRMARKVLAAERRQSRQAKPHPPGAPDQKKHR